MTRVALEGEDWDIMIMRSRSTNHFGNPFSHKPGLAKVRVATVEEAVARFEAWLDGKADQDVEPERRKWILDNLWMLKDMRLKCCCKTMLNPTRICHGDVYVRRCDGQTNET